MRKILTLIALPATLALSAQVSFNVLQPVDIQGSYAHTWAEPDAEGWNTPDMELVENRLIGDLAVAVDATEGDSLVCEAVLNTAAVAGKVALIYRGECNYSTKALNCQQAGAIAVVVINNVAGAPVGMGAGDDGPSVTIPVFQISDVDGALLRAAMDDATVTVLLGNKTGYFASDIGFVNRGILLPPSLSLPSWLAANPGEFTVRVGAYVHNFGTDPSTEVVLSANVVHDGGAVYNEASAPFEVLPGDSFFVELPTFDQDAWEGEYTLTYNTISASSDEYTADNSFEVPFAFDSLFTMVPRDTDTGIPVTTIGIQPAPAVSDFETCLHFRDANASRTAVVGLHLYASIAEPGDMEDELIISRIYQWDDEFTGLSDPNFSISTLTAIHTQEHFVADTGRFVTTYLPFDEAVVLEDDQRYLICANTLNATVFLGHNEDVHMATTEEIHDQPVDPHRGDDGWFIGFVGGAVSSVGVAMIESSAIGLVEREQATVAAWPNPSAGLFQVGLEGHGRTFMQLTDATGRLLRTINTTAALHTIDLRGEARGVYLLSIQSDRGRAVARLVVE